MSADYVDTGQTTLWLVLCLVVLLLAFWASQYFFELRSGRRIISGWRKHSHITWGGILSILLLSTFLLFQYWQSSMLNLESRWLLVAGVPVLIGLITGGYIKSFKGFGVELESSLSKPVSSLELSATVAMKEVRGDEKRTLNYLHSLSVGDRRLINRLVFTQGRTNYYHEYAVQEYLELLPRLKYIEIRNFDKSFVALMPKRILKDRRLENSIAEFINVLENSQILERYSPVLITQNVDEEIGLVESLQLMRQKNIDELVVCDGNGKFLGLLLSKAVERKIVDDVLKAKESA